ncbi:MAG: hypothetical protein KatS3mg043_0777 [Rhodothermaceae bacterium]|nr:MAG: hypothetical protein KatS3mg043_0777 [Rhodothermaceae bacterium]
MSRLPREFEVHPAAYEAVNARGLHRAVCRYVVDGDTADFFIDLGWLQYAYVSVRFYDVDTPELRGTSGAEREAAFRAKARVQELLLDRPCLLRSYKDATTFGRFVATIWFAVPDDDPLTSLTGSFKLEADASHTWVSVAEVLKHEGLIKAAFA